MGKSSKNAAAALSFRKTSENHCGKNVELSQDSQSSSRRYMGHSVEMFTLRQVAILLVLLPQMAQTKYTRGKTRILKSAMRASRICKRRRL
jgi:hypothetical protein